MTNLGFVEVMQWICIVVLALVALKNERIPTRPDKDRQKFWKRLLLTPETEDEL